MWNLNACAHVLRCVHLQTKVDPSGAALMAPVPVDHHETKLGCGPVGSINGRLSLGLRQSPVCFVHSRHRSFTHRPVISSLSRPCPILVIPAVCGYSCRRSGRFHAVHAAGHRRRRALGFLYPDPSYKPLPSDPFRVSEGRHEKSIVRLRNVTVFVSFEIERRSFCRAATES